MLNEERKTLSNLSNNSGISPDLIIDCGAAVGQWSDLARDVWPKAKILSIEPQPEFINILKTKASIDILEECLIHDSCGTKRLNITHNKFDSSMLYAGEFELDIEAHTLECLLLKHGLNPRSILVKTDLQGHDYPAFTSLGRFRDLVDVIQMECQLAPYVEGMTGLSERISVMYKHGLEVFGIFGMLNRPSDGALGQVDIVFVNNRLNLFENCVW